MGDGEVEFKIKGIGNYYGGLNVKKDRDGKFWWGIETYDDTIDYKEIEESLYNELLKHYIGW